MPARWVGFRRLKIKEKRLKGFFRSGLLQIRTLVPVASAVSAAVAASATASAVPAATAAASIASAAAPVASAASAIASSAAEGAVRSFFFNELVGQVVLCVHVAEGSFCWL